MPNFWDWILRGAIEMLDASIVPFLNALDPIFQKIGVVLPMDIIEIALRSYLPIVYPILSMLNFYPLVVAVTAAIAVNLVKLDFEKLQFIAKFAGLLAKFL